MIHSEQSVQVLTVIRDGYTSIMDFMVLKIARWLGADSD